jgi:hypothetical protein
MVTGMGNAVVGGQNATAKMALASAVATHRASSSAPKRQ